jgi:uncharacterized protein YkwD
MHWKCQSCGEQHDSNPSRCSSCGNTVLSPVEDTTDPSSGAERDELLLALFLLIVAVTAAGYTYYSLEMTQSEPAEEMDRAMLEELIHDDINDERTDRGLEPLASDTEIRAVARGHSEQMATEQFLAHTDTNGNTVADRFENAGYNCTVPLNDTHSYTGGENLALSHYDQPVTSPADTTTRYTTLDGLADGIVDGWMNSTEHRENILTDSWRAQGIGVYINGSDSVYVTQNLC